MDIQICYGLKEFLCLENYRVGELDFNAGDSFIYSLSDRPTEKLELLLEKLVEQNVIIDVSH